MIVAARPLFYAAALSLIFGCGKQSSHHKDTTGGGHTPQTQPAPTQQGSDATPAGDQPDAGTATGSGSAADGTSTGSGSAGDGTVTVAIPAYASAVDPVAIAFDSTRDCQLPQQSSAQATMTCTPQTFAATHAPAAIDDILKLQGAEPGGATLGFVRVDCALLHQGIEVDVTDADGSRAALENGLYAVRFTKEAALGVAVKLDPAAAFAPSTCRVDIVARAAVVDAGAVATAIDAFLQGLAPDSADKVKAASAALERLTAPARAALAVATQLAFSDEAKKSVRDWLAALDHQETRLSGAVVETPAYDDVFAGADVAAAICGTEGQIDASTIAFDEKVRVDGDHFALNVCRYETQLKAAYAGFDIASVTATSNAAGATYKAFGRTSPNGGKFLAFALNGTNVPAAEALTLAIVLVDPANAAHKVTVTKTLTRTPIADLAKSFGALRLVGTSRDIVRGPMPSGVLRKDAANVIWVNDKAESTDPSRYGEYLVFEMDYDVPAGTRFFGGTTSSVELFAQAVGDSVKACFLFSNGYGADLDGNMQTMNIAGKGTIRFYGAPSFRVGESDCQARINALAVAGHGLPVHVTSRLGWIAAALGKPEQTFDLELQKFVTAHPAEAAGMVSRTSANVLTDLTIPNVTSVTLIGYPEIQVTLQCKDQAFPGLAPTLTLPILDLAPGQRPAETLAPGAALHASVAAVVAAMQAADHDANRAFFSCAVPVSLGAVSLIETFGQHTNVAQTITPAVQVSVSLAH